MKAVNAAHAWLADANLNGAFMKDASLKAANLARANLRWAKMSGADLEQASLKDAVLFEADMEGANLKGTQFNKARFLGNAILKDAVLSNNSVLPSGEPVTRGWAMMHDARFAKEEPAAPLEFVPPVVAAPVIIPENMPAGGVQAIPAQPVPDVREVEEWNAMRQNNPEAKIEMTEENLVTQNSVASI